MSALEEILRCPECGTQLSRKDANLQCLSGHCYPVRRGVPRFVPDDSYAENFGFEWTLFSTCQLDRMRDPQAWSRNLYGHGQVTAAEESRRTLELKTGLSPAELAGKRVLDVGCGTGRFADIACEWGAEVVGLDLTRAIDVAAKNLSDRPAFSAVQADLRRAPFADASFDVIYSIGVLHHTPSTRESFNALLRLLKPGGTIAIWVYHRAPWRRPWAPPSHVFSDVARLITTRLPNDALLTLCRARASAERKVSWKPLAKLMRKVLPASDHPNPEWSILDTFDWYSPKYQSKHTEDEVCQWYRDAGLEAIVSLGVPVAVRGKKKRQVIEPAKDVEADRRQRQPPDSLAENRPPMPLAR